MKNMDIKKTAKLGALVVSGLGIIGGIIIGVTGYWPIAMVDRTPVTYNRFRENFMMADHFYRSNLKLAGENDQTIMSADARRDLQRVTMEGMVEQILIDHELAKKYSASDLTQLIDNKVEGIDLTSGDMAKGTQLLYGLTPDQFKELVLIPKAKQEILEGNLTLQNGTFNDWLTARKGEAHVSIFIPALYWQSGEVKVK